jgi:dTDP-4-dehydrorhamnose reductase
MGAAMKVLVLGAAGMMGHALYRVLATQNGLHVVGTVRDLAATAALPRSHRADLQVCVFEEDTGPLRALIESFQPHVIINCIGDVGHAGSAQAVWVNAYLPHQLAEIAGGTGARLIHIGTDGVFSGRKGGYSEADMPDPEDFYGRSKLLGEVSQAHCLTLRTSIIGHELGRGRRLLTWLLSQSGEVKGFRRAIFSGLTAAELASVITRHVLPRPELHGILHVSADAISKYELLSLIVAHYGMDITVVPDDTLMIDRSLDSSRFRDLTDYRPIRWPDMIARMREFG